MIMAKGQKLTEQQKAQIAASNKRRTENQNGKNGANGPGGSGGGLACQRGCGNSFRNEAARASHTNSSHLYGN
jgi:hypothetical protein